MTKPTYLSMEAYSSGAGIESFLHLDLPMSREVRTSLELPDSWPKLPSPRARRKN